MAELAEPWKPLHQRKHARLQSDARSGAGSSLFLFTRNKRPQRNPAGQGERCVNPLCRLLKPLNSTTMSCWKHCAWSEVSSTRDKPCVGQRRLDGQSVRGHEPLAVTVRNENILNLESRDNVWQIRSFFYSFVVWVFKRHVLAWPDPLGVIATSSSWGQP